MESDADAPATAENVEEACAAQIRSSLVTRPGGPDAATYRRAYEGYRALYPALRPSFVSLTAVETGAAPGP